ncbi:hypothetical protein M2277_003857 [Paenibacillus sp. LBL]|uniref:hypothetical protein n=1 Tax=Paenibacillus sp. LBL TaxID=2940563 RepID=UPI002475E5B6|nr:hypothetical protein [Paenibacillus sp. LBL]MDH6673192.1 hypothetical protein [Paenibacillus sp. LBL]
MEPIKMIEIDPSETIHLFDVFQKHNIVSSLELNKEGMADPFMAITSQPVKAEYIERFNDESGDAIVVHLGELELCFDIFGTSFFKHISDCQVDICITDGKYSAFFNGGVISPEGIAEARAYTEDFEDSEELLPLYVNSHEQRLIECVRSLEFEDLLDAEDALINASKEAQKNASKKINTKEYEIANGWQQRSTSLVVLSKCLADANSDYRSHIYPEGQSDEQ